LLVVVLLLLAAAKHLVKEAKLGRHRAHQGKQ
jgi:hypothetical protein